MNVYVGAALLPSEETSSLLGQLCVFAAVGFAALGRVSGDLRGVYLGAGAGGTEGESGDDAGIQTVNSSEWKHTHTRTRTGNRFLFFLMEPGPTLPETFKNFCTDPDTGGAGEHVKLFAIHRPTQGRWTSLSSSGGWRPVIWPSFR